MNKAEYKNRYVRTDLACECGEISPEKYKAAIYDRCEKEGIVTERLTVKDAAGEAETGKKIGKYTTVSSENFKNYYLKDEGVKNVLAKEIHHMISEALGKEPGKDTCVLAAGLGNRFITADALGPLTADKINATRHAIGAIPVFDSLDCCRVSVIHTGVLGQTGIESAELIGSVCKEIKPDIVVVIDALAARSVSRLSSTVQLSDAGISPGAGIGNHRLAIDKASLGCPVVSIGVPTVVNSATLIYDALEKAGIEHIDDSLINILENSKSFFVSPKDCDLTNDFLSDVISFGINSTFKTEEF